MPLTDEVRLFSDLAITEANRAAINAIRRPEAWPNNAMCLIGPPRCGLGVIARLWAEEVGAVELSATEFDKMSLNALEQAAGKNCVLDLAGAATNEENFLTLLNRSGENDGRLLLTARAGPATWGCESADLKSRFDAIPVAEIYPPDEEMLKLRLLASCKRRFVLLNEATVNFLVVRLPRSYEAIESYVVQLDMAIEATTRAPSINLAREVLENWEST